MAIADDTWRFVKSGGTGDTRHFVFIVVNAQSESKTLYAGSASPVPLMDAILGATSIPLNEYTFESLVTLHFTIEKFEKDIITGRCADEEFIQGKSYDCADFKAYLVMLTLTRLQIKNREIA